MNDVAALIADMVRAGVDADLVGRAAAALAAPKVDEAAERRRAADRERKASARLRKSAESADGPRPLSQESPQTPKETQPLSPKENTPLRGVQKKGERLPDDFEPDLGWAVAHGLSQPQAAAEAAKFADYWRGKAGKDGTKLDWPATWRNWVRTALERLPQARGSPYRKVMLADGFKAFAEYDNAAGRTEDFGAARQAIPHLSVVSER